MDRDMISDDVVLAARRAAAQELEVWRIREVPVSRLGAEKKFLVDDEPRFYSKILKDANGKKMVVAPPETQIMQADCGSYEQAQMFVSHQTWRKALTVAITKMEEDSKNAN
jgi:hypothetical protein